MASSTTMAGDQPPTSKKASASAGRSQMSHPDMPRFSSHRRPAAPSAAACPAQSHRCAPGTRRTAGSPARSRPGCTASRRSGPCAAECCAPVWAAGCGRSGSHAARPPRGSRRETRTEGSASRRTVPGCGTATSWPRRCRPRGTGRRCLRVISGTTLLEACVPPSQPIISMGISTASHPVRKVKSGRTGRIGGDHPHHEGQVAGGVLDADDARELSARRRMVVTSMGLANIGMLYSVRSMGELRPISAKYAYTDSGASL